MAAVSKYLQGDPLSVQCVAGIRFPDLLGVMEHISRISYILSHISVRQV
jgi:hypothetical protein